MNQRLVIALPGAEAMAEGLSRELGAPRGDLETRRFPDGESYVRLRSDVTACEVVLVAALDHPDDRFLQLAFAARTARELGAERIVLVAPYLPYMRQDKAFHPGEAVTSAQFASLVSREVDALVTVDPHLHRRRALGEIYAIPALAVHSAPLLAAWIAANVDRPMIIGPDAESAQCAAEVAAQAGAPFAVLDKQRLGDAEVAIGLPDLAGVKGRRPVLIDDIAASGETLIKACERLTAAGFAKPVCVVVHPIFAGESYTRLIELAQQVASTTSVPHPSNVIPLSSLLAAGVREIR